MREIKIKAWSKRTKSFVDNYNVTKCFVEKIDCVQFEADESVIVPMEYIGKKDKFGIEIYENFFVRFKKKEQNNNTDWVDVEKIELVTYDVDECEFVANRYYSDGDAVDWSEMEVVGNLFQNPELLSVS